MAAKTGNTYPELRNSNDRLRESAFTTSSVKVSANDRDNDRQPEINAGFKDCKTGVKAAMISFPSVDHCPKIV